MFSLHLCMVLLLTLVAAGETDINNSTEAEEFLEETLILTHVLFRHGNRTADSATELYPNDPYLHENYHPYGHGQLTNAGKRKEFGIGTSLRSRYNDFLGDQYYPEIIEALSTDYNRTKMSLQLVLAGLFPPDRNNMWEENIFWQPVPYNYVPRHQDKVLLGVLCPRYLELYDEVSNSDEMQKEFDKHKAVFDYISEHSGLKVKRFFDIYNLFFGMSTEEDWGLQLPSWTKSVWPETITDLAIRDYYVSMASRDMRRMAIGYFLSKVIEDTKAKIFSSQQPGRKIHLYSGHENNIAELLIGLGIFEPHIPNYGSYVLIEVHRIDDVYGVKIFYENYNDDKVQQLKMPRCDTFCPLDKFMTLVQDYIPSEDLCTFSPHAAS